MSKAENHLRVCEVFVHKAGAGASKILEYGWGVITAAASLIKVYERTRQLLAATRSLPSSIFNLFLKHFSFASPFSIHLQLARIYRQTCFPVCRNKDLVPERSAAKSI